MDFSGIIPALPGLWNGMLMTLQLMVMGVVGGIVLGTILALMRLSSNKLLANIAGIYVNYFRSIPLLLQQSIILFQDTSLVYTVGLVDFLNSARASGDIIGRSNEFLVFAGAVYFVVSFSASWLVKRLQKRITV